jgi:hypothetical protein
MREVARLNFEGKLQAVAEEKGELTQTLDFGNWQAVVSYGVARNGSPKGNSEPIGRALIAKIGENEFLVTGAFCRVDFKAAAGRPARFPAGRGRRLRKGSLASALHLERG